MSEEKPKEVNKDFDVGVMLASYEKAEKIAKEKNIRDLTLIQNLAITFFIQSMNFIKDKQRREWNKY